MKWYRRSFCSSRRRRSGSSTTRIARTAARNSTLRGRSSTAVAIGEPSSDQAVMTILVALPVVDNTCRLGPAEAWHVHPRPVELVQQRRQLHRRQPHHPVGPWRPVEGPALQPLPQRHQSRHNRVKGWLLSITPLTSSLEVAKSNPGDRDPAPAARPSTSDGSTAGGARPARFLCLSYATPNIQPSTCATARSGGVRSGIRNAARLPSRSARESQAAML